VITSFSVVLRQVVSTEVVHERISFATLLTVALKDAVKLQHPMSDSVLEVVLDRHRRGWTIELLKCIVAVLSTFGMPAFAVAKSSDAVRQVECERVDPESLIPQTEQAFRKSFKH
jgi:hypothetical protein